MKFVLKPLVVFCALVFVVACSEAEQEPEPQESEDICELAARHREVCVGDYVTPPDCDAAAQAVAQNMLAVDCEDFETAFPDDGKADGPFCDWFGAGCTPDETIFIGPTCERDADCEASAFCVENHCFEGVTSAEFSETLDLFTQTTEYFESYTRLLAENHDARMTRLGLIDNAEHHIHFSAFVIKDDSMGHELVASLVAAAERGVEVRVIVDATSQYFMGGYPLLEELAAGGVDVLAYNPITEWARLRLGIWGLNANMRFHEKVMVVDGQTAIVGSRNISEEYLLEGRWRDDEVFVHGPGVRGIQRKYLTIWDKIRRLEVDAGCPNQSRYGFYCTALQDSMVDDQVYFPSLNAAGSAVTRAIASDPYTQETAVGYFTTLALIRGARESITITNAYFVPPRRLRKHLRAAAQRGVRVRVLTNSKGSTDGWQVYYAGLNYYKELINSGVEIWEYRGEETMHSKSMLIDNELAVIGSYNLDPRSAIDNSEFMLLAHSAQVVEELERAMAVDFANADRASADIPYSELLKARSMRIIEPLL